MRKLIVALDDMGRRETYRVGMEIKPYCEGVKLGDVVLEGGLEAVIWPFKAAGMTVMVDNKWWDIPKTVRNKVARENDAGADLITVSLNNNDDSLRAARKAAKNAKLVGVTVLTSSHPYYDYSEEFRTKVKMAFHAGLDGVTVPAPLLGLFQIGEEDEVHWRDKLFTLTPGVRMPGDTPKGDDQKMVTNKPPEADFVVVGTPITDKECPATAAEAYQKWLKGEK